MSTPSLSMTGRMNYRLAKMPREQRDTLFILGTIFFVLLPHFAYLPLWASIITGVTLLWRAWLTRGTAKLPGVSIKVGLLVIIVSFTALNFKTIAGLEAGCTLLVMLTSLKTLELRARRDAVVIFYLGFFLLIMGFTQSQSILMALDMLIALTLLMTALVNAHMPARYPPLHDALRVALRLILWGLPMMIVLFLTFPRLDPLWALPNNMLLKSGISSEMTIDGIRQLALDNSVAFRIQFKGNTPAQKDLYFRGPVLSDFDGAVWRARNTQMQSVLNEIGVSDYFQVSGPSISYEITQETTNQPWLLTLDLTPLDSPPQLDNQSSAYMLEGAQWMMQHIISERIRYRAQAYPNYRLGSNMPDSLLEIETRLPPEGNPRTRQWAQQLLQNPDFAALNNIGKAQWLLNYIRREEYHYTLILPEGYTPENAADQLWFDYRAGFCEHYASAFVILMRAMGIPSRIVTGYQGGERNLVDNYWIVRQSNAHAWAEVWQEGMGWVRVDPTAAIAPYRIENSSMNPSISGIASRNVVLADLPWLDQLRMRWDAMQNYWNQWVLGYSVSSGLQLLDQFGLHGATWGTLAVLLLALLALAALLIFTWRYWRARPKDRWLRAYTKLRLKLARAGFSSDTSTAPRTLARQLQSTIPQSPDIQEAQQLLLQLEELHYAPSAKPKQPLKSVARSIQRLHIASHS